MHNKILLKKLTCVIYSLNQISVQVEVPNKHVVYNFKYPPNTTDFASKLKPLFAVKMLGH